VPGSNNDPGGMQGWSEKPSLLEFTIRPSWCASWWAYLLYFLVVSGLVLLGYRYQLRQRMQVQETLRLRELDAFKNRFFTNITHEFRTPLTVILGEAEKLQQERSAPERSAGLIRRSGENLLRLVNQLLDLAKLESNSLHIHYVQGEVSAYLRYIVESLRGLADSRSIRLQVESPATEIVMDYDPERLLQIVYNLLSNAIKFTPADGKVELGIDLLHFEDADWLEIRVADSGPGIPPGDLLHIFDRFYQIQNPEHTKAGGTGIGLALSKELVTAMGGEINVESEEGKGSTFTVRLPVSRQAERMEITSVDPPIEQERQVQMPMEAPPEAPTLLIVEDHPDVVDFLTSCLGEKFVLHLAYNGREGIEKALEIVPDLIISDVMMPEINGFELCETLKTDERSSHIPIVLLTAKAGVENRITGLRRGADAYLAKPFHEEELQATLDNLLEQRRKLREKYMDAVFHPQAVAPTADVDPEKEFLQKVKAIILQHLSDAGFSVDDLCRTLTISQPQLHRKLTALTGKNATLFIRSIRLAKARELLQASGKNVSQVAYEVGFSDPKYFSRVFTKEFGLPPSKV